MNITDNKSGSAIEIQDVDNYKYRTAFASVKGVGLINCSTYALTVNNLKLSGKISVKTYNLDGLSIVNEDLSTGGIVGEVTLSLKSVEFMCMADLKQAVLWEILRKATNSLLRILR